MEGPPWPFRLPPNNFSTNFANYCQENRNSDRLITELVHFFGQDAGQDPLFKLFPSKVKQKLGPKIKSLRKRLEKIREKSLSLYKLSPSPVFSSRDISPFYPTTAYAGIAPEELLAQDILSQPMPQQLAKTLRCYDLKAVSHRVNHQQQRLDDMIQKLFQLKLNGQQTTVLNGIDWQEELDAFKYAAIVRDGHPFSWGDLLLLWTKKNGLSKVLDQKFRIHHLVTNNRHCVNAENLSFKEFVISQTLYVLFKDGDKAPLPSFSQGSGVWESLYEIFDSTDSDVMRRDTLFYVKTLRSWQQGLMEYPFQRALNAIKAWIPDKQSSVYHFLHSAIHYFHCLSVFDISEDHTRAVQILFEAIYAMPLEQQEIFNKPIEEKGKRSDFQFKQKLVDFFKDHALAPDRWGEIFLRFSQTKTPQSGDISFGDTNFHLTLIEDIEKILTPPIILDENPPENTFPDPYRSSPNDVLSSSEEESPEEILPTEVIFKLLFFQTAKPTSFDAVNNCATFRQTILRDYLNTLAIPPEMYKEWELLNTKLLEAIETSPELSKVSQGYASLFPQAIATIARLLQLVTYPRPFVFFKDLMPIQIEAEGPLFSENSLVEELQLCEEDFAMGPAWLGRWVFDKRTGMWCFFVSIMNSMRLERTCTFYVHLPPNLSQPDHLKLLRELVDGLGREAPSEEESLQMQEKSLDTTHSVPVDIINKKAPPSEMLDSYLACSSPMKLSYEHFSSETSQENPENTKEELYTFVKSLQVGLKKAFYFALNPEMTQPFLEAGGTPPTIYLTEEEFCLIEPSLSGDEDLTHCIVLEACRNSLLSIYDTWTENEMESCVVENAFFLDIDGGVTFPVRLKICQEETFMRMTMEIDKDGEVLHSMSLKHSEFEEEENFVFFMQWQMALFKQECLELGLIGSSPGTGTGLV